MKEKVSVVVTCYNHENYIEQCLRSIFTQTHQNIELLVFNDGSTDASDEVIARVLVDSPFVETHYLSKENRGVSQVRNEALAKFTGDFLLFVDSDNFLNKAHVEQLLTALSEAQADIAYCQLWDFENARDVLREDLDYSLEKELEGNLIDVSSLVKREVLTAVKFDESLSNLEDYDFWLNVLLNHQAKAVFTGKTKLNYRALENSRSAREDWQKYYASYFYIINKYREKIPSELIKALQNNLLLWIEKYQILQINSEKQLTDKENHIKTQEEVVTKALHDKDIHIASLNQEITDLRNSRAFRLGNKILHPLGNKK